MIQTLSGDLTSPDGKPWEFTLGPKTLVVARNGRGKTRLSHALRLALTNTTDDLLGRNMVKDRGLLATLIAKGAASVGVKAVFQSGEEASWSLTREADGTLKTPQHRCGLDPETVLPLRGIRALLVGDESAARATLLSWIGGSATEMDVLAYIPAHLHESFRAKAAAIPGSPVDKLALVADAARLRALEIERDAAARDALVDHLGQSMAQGRPSAESLEAAQGLVAQWTTALASASAYEAQPPQVELPTEDVAAMQAAVTEAEGALGYWRDAADAARRAAEDAIREAQRAAVQNAQAAQATQTLLSSLVATLAASEDGTCRACGSAYGPEHIHARHAWFVGQIAFNVGAPPAVPAAVSDDGVASTAMATARAADANAEGWLRVLHDRQQALADVHRRGEAAMRPRLPHPGVSAAEARVALDHARVTLDQLTRAHAAWEQVTAARDAAAALRSEKPQQEELAAACARASFDLLQALSAEFESKVQAYMPEDLRFSLQLRDGDRNVCRVLVNGNAALSGVQRDAVSVALAMVVAALGGGAVTAGKKAKKGAASMPSRYTLIIPEDRDRDEVTLGELMRAWSPYPGQVVLEATRRPRGKLPAGWTVIDLDAWYAERTKKEEGTGEAEGPAAAATPRDATPAVETPAYLPETLPAGPDDFGGEDPPHAPAVRAPEADAEARLLPYLDALPATASDPQLAREVATSLLAEGRSPDLMAERYALRLLERKQAERAAAERAAAAQPSLFPAPASEERDALLALGFPDEKIGKLNAEMRAYIVTHKVSAPRVMIMAKMVTIFDVRGQTAATFKF